MSNVQQERLIKLQENAKNELEKVHYQNQKDLEQLEQKMNRLRDEKANESREVAKV